MLSSSSAPCPILPSSVVGVVSVSIDISPEGVVPAESCVRCADLGAVVDVAGSGPVLATPEVTLPTPHISNIPVTSDPRLITITNTGLEVAVVYLYCWGDRVTDLLIAAVNVVVLVGAVVTGWV